MYQKEIIYLGLYKDGNRMGSAGFLKVENRNRESKCYLKVQNLPLGINGRFPIRVYSGTGWKELNGIAIQDGGGNWEDNLPENIDKAMIQVMLSGGYMLEGKSKSAVELSGRKSVDEPQDADESGKDNVMRDAKLYGNGNKFNHAEYSENSDEPSSIESLRDARQPENVTDPENVNERRDITNPVSEPGTMMNLINIDAHRNTSSLESIDETRRMGSQVNSDIPGDMMNLKSMEESRNTNNQIESNAPWNMQELENISNVREKEGSEQMQKNTDALHSKDSTMNTYESRKELKSWNIGNSWRTQNQNNPTRARRVNTSNNQNSAEGINNLNNQNRAEGINSPNNRDRTEGINTPDNQDRVERRNSSNIQNNRPSRYSAGMRSDTGSQKNTGEYMNRQPQTIIITEELPRQVQTNTDAAPYGAPEYSVKEDKWEQILDTYENIHPYGDERVYVKLEPKDFVILQSKYQHLVNNSFLLHGFYNYRYVILGKEEDYYLGVPGVFYEREKMVALMFGFEAFECPGGTVRAGEFGYYLRKVEL